MEIFGLICLLWFLTGAVSAVVYYFISLSSNSVSDETGDPMDITPLMCTLVFLLGPLGLIFVGGALVNMIIQAVLNAIYGDGNDDVTLS